VQDLEVSASLCTQSSWQYYSETEICNMTGIHVSVADMKCGPSVFSVDRYMHSFCEWSGIRMPCKQIQNSMRFTVLTVVLLRSQVFWNVTPHWMVNCYVTVYRSTWH